jgi:hypothetical protein
MVDAKPDQSQSVQVRTIPQILDECRVADREIDLLKCDIEGAERELFSECAEWIQRVRTIVIEIHAPYTVDAMGEDLRRAGAAFEVVSRNGTVYVFRRRLSAAQARA